MAENEAPESTALAEVRGRFAEFLERNPVAELDERAGGADGKPRIQIKKPWGDDSVAIFIPDKPAALAAALNKVFLPERLSALWHSDTKRLEVIWTALKPSASQKEIVGRKFQFVFKGKKHDCAFAKASDRLIEIAKHTLPQGMTNTNHRNIQSFYHFANAEADVKEALSIEEPRSFWIYNVSWNDTKSIDLINNLNFYLSYYDDMSPTIVVHLPTEKDSSSVRRARYIHGKFPETIVSQGLNDHLLGFWSAANAGSPPMRFILYYRIIEYASHHYLDEDIRLAIKQLISSPHLSDDVSDAIEKITDIVSAKKNEDIPKFKGLVNRCVKPELIWKEAQINKAFFSKETKFEGGFSVRALIPDGDNQSAFCGRGLDGFCDLLRKIRNALSHGRDQETGGVISATTRNYQLLRPWVHLVGTAAGEVVLLKDVT